MRCPLASHAASSNQLNHEHNQRDDEQQVNEASGDLETESERPQD